MRDFLHLWDFCEIFAPIGGGVMEMCHRMLSIAIWDKISYSPACVKDFCRIFAPIGGFSRMGHRMLPIAFSPTDPRCHGNEIQDKIDYNSVCVRDISEIFCICARVFGIGPTNAANWILPRPTLVAMATKFKTKWAIPRLVQQISPRSLHLTKVRVDGLAIRWHPSKSIATTANPDFQVKRAAV